MGFALQPAIAAGLASSPFRIIITGASGWLGMATLEMLHGLLGPALTDRVLCFGSSARTLTLPFGFTMTQEPLSALAELPAAPSLLLHYAFLTKEKAEQQDEAAYRKANAAIASLVEAALLPIDVRAIFVASSGAAYSGDDPAAGPAMRLYGAMKRDDEDRFAAWATRTGRRAVIGRVFNISGRHINKLGSYALASFVVDALAGRRIVVKAPHRVERGMVDVADVINLVFAELLAAPDGVARFETAGDAMELGDVAQAVADTLGAPGVDRAAITSTHVDHYVGDPAIWLAACARQGIVPSDLASQIRQTAEFLAEIKRRP